MNLHNVQTELRSLLEKRDISQYEFATRHGLSYSSVNKFLNEDDPNPRFSSLQALLDAMDRERATQ